MSCNCQEAASILARCYGQAQPRAPRKDEMFRSWTADITRAPPKTRGEKRARVTKTKRVLELEKDVANLRKQLEERVAPRVTPTRIAPTRVTRIAPGNLQEKKKTAFDYLKERQFDRFVSNQLDDDELEEYTTRRREAISMPRKVRRMALGLSKRTSQGRKGKRRGGRRNALPSSIND